MEDAGFSLQAVTAAIAGDKEGFANAFNSAIANKVTDALEVKKVEIASNLLGVQDSNEPEAVEAEVDGSGNGSDGIESTSDVSVAEA